MGIPEICATCGKLAFPGESVTISAVEYDELLRFKTARTETHSNLASYRLASHSRIARDPELAQFIIACAETMMVKDVRQACVERFGEKRVPHRTTIGTFIREHAGPSRRYFSR